MGDSSVFRFRRLELGKSEIQNLRASIAAKKDVVGLKIAMNDSLIVRRRQAMSDLHRVLDGLAPGQRTAGQTSAERRAFEKFGDKVRGAVMRTHVVNRENIGMIECPRRSRLLFKPAQAIGILADKPGQDLDGYVALQARISGTIHFAHSARPKQCDNLVWPDFRSGCEVHLASDYTARRSKQ